MTWLKNRRVLHWVYCHWCRLPLPAVGLWSPRRKWMDTLSCTERSFPPPLEWPPWVYSLQWPEGGSNPSRSTCPRFYSHSHSTPGHKNSKYHTDCWSSGPKKKKDWLPISSCSVDDLLNYGWRGNSTNLTHQCLLVGVGDRVVTLNVWKIRDTLPGASCLGDTTQARVLPHEVFSVRHFIYCILVNFKAQFCAQLLSARMLMS